VAGVLRLPIFALMLGVIAVAMLGPAGFAAVMEDWRSARNFLYGALFCGVTAGIVALAIGRAARNGTARREIAVLIMCWIGLPVFAAIPLGLITPALGLWGALFEMSAAFTTTGGTAYGRLMDVPDAVHLWRGTVAWLGGFLTLTSAYVVLSPHQMGGFEIEAATWRISPAAQRDRGQRGAQGLAGLTPAPVESRIARAVRAIAPLYLMLTLILAFALGTAGQSGLASVVHAMAILSTSGISPGPDGFATARNLPAEACAALFMALAATRMVYTGAAGFSGRRRLPHRDPELQLMAALVALVTLTLFLRHWIGALTITRSADLANPLEALWGMVFTVLSFLTTTGFRSAAWEGARDWSGLANPGLLLLALAAIGGGAATTAGGIKLIRAYALIRHGVREMERIAQPNAVLGIGRQTRSLLREGPVIVWTFVMLFIFAILGSVLCLTLAGLTFQTALVASIAALSNTGPAFSMVNGEGMTFASLTPLQRMILIVPMILGRVETLALVALFNPDAWQGTATLREDTSRKSAGKTLVKPPQSR
jgi:trk system potassium uptake protein TrkH